MAPTNNRHVGSLYTIAEHRVRHKAIKCVRQEGLHFKVYRSLQVIKDLHDCITDFWANSVSRNHGDGLGLSIAR